jgi:branched-chain amino acid transport system permease protein
LAELGQYLLNGISQGCLYVLLASGLTILLGIMNVPNFAQGHLYMVAAYLGFYMVMSYGMNYWLALVLATFALGILGMVVYFFVFYPVRNAPEVNLFVAAMALLMILEGGALSVFGTETKWFLIPWSRSVMSFGGLSLQVQRLIVIAGTAVVMSALWLFIKKTALGAALEATAQHREGALLCGIKVNRVSAMAFVIGTALAATMGMGPLLVAFSAVVFGGLGSIPGALVGSLFLGVAESLTSGYISAKYSLAFVFVIMIVTLLFRPKGLFGKEVWRP